MVKISFRSCDQFLILQPKFNSNLIVFGACLIFNWVTDWMDIIVIIVLVTSLFRFKTCHRPWRGGRKGFGEVECVQQSKRPRRRKVTRRPNTTQATTTAGSSKNCSADGADSWKTWFTKQRKMKMVPRRWIVEEWWMAGSGEDRMDIWTMAIFSRSDHLRRRGLLHKKWRTLPLRANRCLSIAKM